MTKVRLLIILLSCCIKFFFRYCSIKFIAPEDIDLLFLNAPSAPAVGNTFDSVQNEVSVSHTEIEKDFAAASVETDNNHELEKANGDFI